MASPDALDAPHTTGATGAAAQTPAYNNTQGTSPAAPSAAGAAPTAPPPGLAQYPELSGDAGIRFLSGLGVSGQSLSGVDPTLLQDVVESLDAKHAGDISIFDGFSFGNVPSITDFQRAFGWAQTFASITGYKNFPPLKLLAGMGPGMDKQQAFEQFYAALSQPAQQSMPYAQFGLTKEDYNTTAATYLDALEQATGTRTVDQGLLNTAVGEHWSSQRFMDSLKKDQSFNSQFGWVQYGKSFTEWLNYKQQNQAEVASRYGQAAIKGAGADQFYLQNLANPLQRANVQEATGQQPLGPANQSQMSGYVKTQDASHASSVR